MDSQKIINLIKAICVRIQELEGYLNKTKLLKLLYLIDVEHYRKYDATFTSFNWIFYEFGPWAYDYNKIYDQIESLPDFKISKKGVPEEAQYISCTSGEIDLGDIFPKPEDSLIFKEIVNKWAVEDLSKLLNFVYFHTEPMVDAIKNKTLDFTKIKNLERIPDFRLQKGTLSEEQKKEHAYALHSSRPHI